MLMMTVMATANCDGGGDDFDDNGGDDFDNDGGDSDGYRQL